MDSVDPMQVDPQDTCFTAKSALGGLDSDYPDAENPGNVKRIITSTGARIHAEMNRGGLRVEQEEKAGQAVPSRLLFDWFLKATDTKEESEGDNVKGWSGVDVGCLGGGSGHGSGWDGGVAVGSVGLADDAEAVVERETKDDMQIIPQVKEDVGTESCIGCGNGDKKRKEMDEGLVADSKVVVKKEDEDGVHTLPQVKKEVMIEVEFDFGCANGDGVINAMPINWVKPVVGRREER